MEEYTPTRINPSRKVQDACGFRGMPDERRLLTLAEEIRRLARKAYYTPGAGVAWGHLRDAARLLERKVEKSKRE